MPNNLGEDDTPVDIVEAIELIPLPEPLAVTGTFNRFGPFFPGVSKSSSAVARYRSRLDLWNFGHGK
jgi:hypothetical protein